MKRGFYMATGIVGTGYYVPDKIMTNQDIEKFLDTSDKWIFDKVGIKERRIAELSQSTSDLAVEAALRAIKNAGLNVDQIDLIVLATSSPDMIQPPTASIVQGKLGAVNAAAFDVGAVCAGFAYAINVGTSMREFNGYKNVLVIGAEVYSRIMDWNDRTTCVFFGDGAGAVILGEVPDGYGFLSSFLMTEGKHSDVIRFQAGGTLNPTTHETLDNNMHRFEMNGKMVWDFAHRVFPLSVRNVVEKVGYLISDLKYVISHQANINIIRNSLEALGLDMKNTHTTIEKYANTSGASIPITLADANNKGLLKSGDLICFVGFGGGLSYGASLFKWFSKEKK